VGRVAAMKRAVHIIAAAVTAEEASAVHTSRAIDVVRGGAAPPGASPTAASLSAAAGTGRASRSDVEASLRSPVVLNPGLGAVYWGRLDPLQHAGAREQLIAQPPSERHFMNPLTAQHHYSPGYNPSG
jgi:hypothetical protein